VSGCFVVPSELGDCIFQSTAVDVSLQDLASGLDGVIFNDLMENIEWLFEDKDGSLTENDVLTFQHCMLPIAGEFTNVLDTVHILL
jgi:hypothetical protein